MPTDTLSLAVRLDDYDIHLEVSRPSWLFARTQKVLGKVGLFVYRSVMVRDDDPMYAPVAEFLAKCRAEIVRSSEVDNPNMMFGRAEWRFYLIHKATLDEFELDPEFEEQMRAECRSLIEELTGDAA